MTWHYQIVEHKIKDSTVYSIIEVYKTSNNQIFAREIIDASTEKYDSPREIIENLEYKYKDAVKWAVKKLEDIDTEIQSIPPEDNPWKACNDGNYTPWD